MPRPLIEAIKSLDTTNDNHWTSDGLPRLDVLQSLTNRPVSRDEVSTMAKGFTRKNPTLPETKAPAVAPVDIDITDDAAIEAELTAARENQVKANQRMKAATNAMDAVILKRSKEQAQISQASMVKAYQASQAAQRMKQVTMAKQALKTLNMETKA